MIIEEQESNVENVENIEEEKINNENNENIEEEKINNENNEISSKFKDDEEEFEELIKKRKLDLKNNLPVGNIVESDDGTLLPETVLSSKFKNIRKNLDFGLYDDIPEKDCKRALARALNNIEKQEYDNKDKNLQEDIIKLPGQNYLVISWCGPSFKAKTDIYGLKILGAFNDIEDARKHCFKVNNEDPTFDVGIIEMYKWCFNYPLMDNSENEDEYDNNLNKHLSEYKKEREISYQMFEMRKKILSRSKVVKEGEMPEELLNKEKEKIKTRIDNLKQELLDVNKKLDNSIKLYENLGSDEKRNQLQKYKDDYEQAQKDLNTNNIKLKLLERKKEYYIETNGEGEYINEEYNLDFLENAINNKKQEITKLENYIDEYDQNDDIIDETEQINTLYDNIEIYKLKIINNNKKIESLENIENNGSFLLDGKPDNDINEIHKKHIPKINDDKLRKTIETKNNLINNNTQENNKELNLERSNTRIELQEFAAISFVNHEGTNKRIPMKISGVFETEELTNEHIEQLTQMDNTYDIFVVPLYRWLPCDPDISKIKQKHTDDKLNKLIEGSENETKEAMRFHAVSDQYTGDRNVMNKPIDKDYKGKGFSSYEPSLDSFYDSEIKASNILEKTEKDMIPTFSFKGNLDKPSSELLKNVWEGNIEYDEDVHKNIKENKDKDEEVVHFDKLTNNLNILNDKIKDLIAEGYSEKEAKSMLRLKDEYLIDMDDDVEYEKIDKPKVDYKTFDELRNEQMDIIKKMKEEGKSPKEIREYLDNNKIE